MNKKLTTFIEGAKNFKEKNKSAIFAGTAMAGIVLTGITAYKAGLKARDILERKNKAMEQLDPKDTEGRKKIFWSTAKEMAFVILPPVIIGGASMVCVFSSHRVSSKKIAALSAAYSVSEKSLKELNDKMVDTLGLKKATSIKEQIAKDHVKNDPPKDGQIIITGDGDVLCRDGCTGRYFRSNAQKIGMAINELSSMCASDMYVSLNDMYDILGIPEVPLGNEVGWNSEDMVKGQLPITFAAVLTEDDKPCLAIEYDIFPRTDYRNLM